MTFKKPKNVRFVDMAIWIDENCYEKGCNEDTLYQYLYFLSYMLAHKHNYFKKSKDYDQFSLYCATELYLRIKNQKQYQYDDEGCPKLPKIKSILNYLKKTIYAKKVDFEQEHYCQKYSSPSDDTQASYELYRYMVEATDKLRMSDFEAYIGDIPNVVHNYLLKLPMKKNSSEWHNIYLSCVLSLLNGFTLSNDEAQYIAQLREHGKLNVNRINRVCNSDRTDFILLYHLPLHMHDYIKAHVNNLKQIISNDLSYFASAYVPTHMLDTNAILAEMEEYEHD